MSAPGGVPGPGGWVCLLWGVYLVPGGCWLQGGVPGPGGVGVSALGGVPGPGGCWLKGSVPGPGGVSAWGRGCTWSWGVYLVPGEGVPGPGGSALGECTWSWGGVCSWGVSAPRGVYLVLGGEPDLVLGGVPGQVLPPCGQTDNCKHITLPQTSFAGGN